MWNLVLLFPAHTSPEFFEGERERDWTPNPKLPNIRQPRVQSCILALSAPLHGLSKAQHHWQSSGICRCKDVHPGTWHPTVVIYVGAKMSIQAHGIPQ